MTPSSVSGSRVLRTGTLHTTRFYDAVVEAGVLIALVIAPLYFNALTYRTFDPDKAALLRSIVLVMAGAWIAKQFAARSSGFAFHRPSSLFRLPPAFLPALLLLAATAISTAASILPRISLWGSYDRGQGFYTFAAYLGLFLFTYGIARRPGTWMRVLQTILLTSVPVSIYAILQHYGLDVFRWQTAGSPTTERAISTLGNPIFLGAYLIMVMPLTLAQLVRARQRRTKDVLEIIVYGMLLAIQVLALFFTQSRGPVLGLLGSLAFWGLIWSARRRDRRALLAAGLTVGLLIVVVVLVRSGELSGMARPRTVQQRMLAWQGIIDLACSNPLRVLIGYGPETLREAVSPHLPAELARLIPDQEFDRAHNLVFDTWASTGVLGVLAWLLLIGTVVYHGLRGLEIVAEEQRLLFTTLAATGVALGLVISLVTRYPLGVGVSLPLGLLGGISAYLVWQILRDPATRAASRSKSARTPRSSIRTRRAIKSPGNEAATNGRFSMMIPPEVLLALIVGIVAHVVETLVGIPTTATQTLFWVYAALIAASMVPATIATPYQAAEEETRTIGESVWGVLTGVILALLAFSILGGGQGTLGQGFLLWAILMTTTLLFGMAMLWLATMNASTPPDVLRYLVVALSFAVALVALVWISLLPNDRARSSIAVFLYIFTALIALGLLLDAGSAAAVPERRLSGRRMAALIGIAALLLIVIWRSSVNPIRADVYYKQALIQMQAARWEQAVSAFRRSLALAPQEDRYHAGLGAAYVQLAQRAGGAVERARWLQLAEVRLLQAHQLDPYRADHLRNVGILYRLWADLGPPAERVSRLRQALEYYEQAVQRNPTSVRAWREWGAVYAALGEWEEAIRRYEESLRLNDGFVETWMLLAEARLNQADYSGALQAYTQAIALDQTRVLQERRAAVENSPGDPLLHQALALVYAVLGQSQAAMAEADVARDLLGEESAGWAEFLTVLEEASKQ